MTELIVKLPVKINGVLINKDVYNELNSLQFDGTAKFDEPRPALQNEGVNLLNNYMDKISSYLVRNAANKDTDETRTEEIDLLIKLYWVKESINMFKIPDNSE